MDKPVQEIGEAGRTKVGFVGKSRISIGRFTYGYENLTLHQWGEGANLEIGAFCSLAAEISIMLGGNHRLDWVTTFPFGHIFTDELGGRGLKGHPATKGDIVIGNDVWIGRNVTIMSGVRIGDGAAIAANSTVIRDIGPYEVWGGNPAGKIKDRFPKDITDELLGLRWWDMEIANIQKIAPTLSSVPTVETLRALKPLGLGHQDQQGEPVTLHISRAGRIRK